MFELIATPRRETEPLKTVWIEFPGLLRPNAQDHGSSQQLHEDSTDFILILENLFKT